MYKNINNQLGLAATCWHCVQYATILKTHDKIGFQFIFSGLTISKLEEV